jgi:hypothetical protein
MGTIRVFFANGSHEDRPDTCPVFGARPAKHPRAVTVRDSGNGFVLGAQGPLGMVASWALLECYRDRQWWAYRLTDEPGERLRGRWELVRIESYRDQIERLTRERDEARRLFVLCVPEIDDPERDEYRRLYSRAKQEGWLP